MTNDNSSAPEADGLSDKSEQDSLAPAAGVTPGSFNRPKRRRAWHRAVKRNEHWAVMEKMMKDTIMTLNAQLYAHVFEPGPLAFAEMFNDENEILGLGKTVSITKIWPKD